MSKEKVSERVTLGRLKVAREQLMETDGQSEEDEINLGSAIALIALAETDVRKLEASADMEAVMKKVVELIEKDSSIQYLRAAKKGKNLTDFGEGQIEMVDHIDAILHDHIDAILHAAIERGKK